jgi:hypothetical protein
METQMTVINAAARFAERREWNEEERGFRLANPSGVLDRFDFIVEILATKYIRPGWNESFDKAWAARTRRYLERLVAGEPHNELEGRVAWGWFFAHGQSLDWVEDGDPAAMIASCASSSGREERAPPMPEVIELRQAATEHVT